MQGNQQKTRKVLAVICDWILKAGYVYGYPDTRQERRKLFDMMTKALSAKPRNCDVFSKDEVFKELKDRSFSKEDTIEWLYAEAKGESKHDAQ
jgi:hypothetical protein